MAISSTLAAILASKAEGFETAQEIIAKEGKEWGISYFQKASKNSEAIAYWRGFLNALVGMSAKDSHGYI